MQRYNILWADDEIDLLKPHLLFLNNKGYEVTPVNSGPDAIDECEKNIYDVVFLDENMPGMTGLETLNHIKSLRPNLPVVMITKSEEEHIMEEAIGARIADYLIKPVNPNQILSSVKKILENKRLISERTNLSYQQDFQQISMVLNDQIDSRPLAPERRRRRRRGRLRLGDQIPALRPHALPRRYSHAGGRAGPPERDGKMR